MKRFDEWRERNTGGGSSNGGGVGEVVGKFFADWKAGAPGGNGNGRRPSGASAGQMPGDIGALLTHRDPWPELLRAMGQAENQHRLFIGTDRSGNGGIWTTEARRNLLILGPPRSSKTVGVLVPAILAHPGPVVSTSTREDVYDATAIVRTRMGRLWHFNADGGELLPGCIPLRWSPIIPSKDWAAAISLGKAMADISDSGNGEYSAYFRTKAGVVIAALLHAAALGEKPMLWLLRAVNGERRILEEAEEILDSSFEPDTQIALSDLRGVLELDERTRSNVFSTTANAFAAYRLPGALASTEPGEDGYFDPAAFVAGQPDGYNPRRFAMLWPQDVREELEGFRFENQAVGVYDTVYLTASSSRQALVAPLVAALLSQLRDACFDRHRKDRAKGKRRPATLWALDEVAGIAPMKDLPEATLSQSGGQGLLVACVLQDLSLARAKWGEAGEGFLTLFGNIVVFPRLRDKETLEAISALAGYTWITVTSSGQSAGRGAGGRQSGWNVDERQERVPALDPGVISEGRFADSPDSVLGLTAGASGVDFYRCTPYYSAPPWPHLLVACMEYAARYGNQALETGWDVRPPILNEDGSYRALMAAGGQELADRYKTALGRLDEYAAEAADWRAQLPESSLLSDYEASFVSYLRAPVRCLIGLRDNPGLDKLNDLLTIHDEVRPAYSDEELIIPVSTKDGVSAPVGDLPDNPVHPDWLIESHDQKACLSVVHGGLVAMIESGNTLARRWDPQLVHPRVVLDVWSWSVPALHMVGRLTADLSQLSPVCLITKDGAMFHGPWSRADAA